MQDLNNGALVCRLTRDPELRSLPNGNSVCSLRVAFTTSRKESDGSWGDKSNYADVTVWGAQGESVARTQTKGAKLGIVYRLEFREWETQSGDKRSALELIANSVQFLDPKDSNGGGFTPRSDVPVDTAPAPARPATNDDEDIPF